MSTPKKEKPSPKVVIVECKLYFSLKVGDIMDSGSGYVNDLITAVNDLGGNMFVTDTSVSTLKQFIAGQDALKKKARESDQEYF
jgi:hypothetical protein